jgi:hypothetical protein
LNGFVVNVVVNVRKLTGIGTTQATRRLDELNEFREFATPLAATGGILPSFNGEYSQLLV